MKSSRVRRDLQCSTTEFRNTAEANEFRHEFGYTRYKTRRLFTANYTVKNFANEYFGGWFGTFSEMALIID